MIFPKQLNLPDCLEEHLFLSSFGRYSQHAIFAALLQTLMSKDGTNRKDIYRGLEVGIILKKDQRSGKITYGFVKDILTSSAFHSRGIKVRLDDGQIGRVAEIPEEEQ